MEETPGQKARRLVREAEALLEDPSKADYHERLRVAIDNMNAELSFWEQIAAVNAMVDIANEREEVMDGAIPSPEGSSRPTA